MTDFCSYLRERNGEELSALGFREVACRQFGEELTGHGKMFANEVAFHKRNDHLIAIAYSAGNGSSCWVGRGGCDLETYRQWPSLWHVLGMDAGIDLERPSEADWERLGKSLEQMPKGLEANLDFIVAKLAELPTT